MCGGRGKIGLADFQMDDAASLRFERARAHQHFKGGFDADAAHSFGKFHDVMLSGKTERRRAVSTCDDAVVDRDALAHDAAGDAAAVVERDDRRLIRHVLDERLGRESTPRFRYKQCRSSCCPQNGDHAGGARAAQVLRQARANAARSAARPLRRGSAAPGRRSAPRRSRPPDGLSISARRWC